MQGVKSSFRFWCARVFESGIKSFAEAVFTQMQPEILALAEKNKRLNTTNKVKYML